MAPARTTFSRQRTPMLIATFFAGSAIFLGMKWNAVQQRSQAAKKANSIDGKYAVAAGRSGGGI